MVKIILTAGQIAQCPALDTNPCKVSEFYLNYFTALARNACKDFSCNGTFLIWSLRVSKSGHNNRVAVFNGVFKQEKD